MSTSRTREKADGELFKSTGIDDNATSTKVTVSNTGIAVAGDVEVNFIKSNPNNVLTFKLSDNTTVGSFSNTTGALILPLGVALGGAGAANTLSDYEEGTFVATLRGSVNDPSTAVTTTSMYRKIGETVYIQIAFENWNTAGASGQIQVTGLPFTSSPTGRFFISNSFYEGASWASSGIPTAYVTANSTNIQCFTIRSSAAWQDTSHNAGGSRYFWFAGTYPTGA